MKNEVRTNKPKTVLTEEKKKEDKMHSPQLAALYFAFKSHLHKLPSIKLTIM